MAPQATEARPAQDARYVAGGGPLWLSPQGSFGAQQAGPSAPPAPALAASPATASAQAPAAKPDLSVQVKLVTVYATVRDKHGKIVPGLSQDNFTAEEDGREEKITYFARESDLPLTLGLLVDTGGSLRSALEDERDASYTFLDQLLREGKDTAFLIHFDSEVELLQDITGSRDKLRSALKLLRTADPNRGGSGNGGQGRDYRGGVSHLYDAIYLSSNELMKKRQGRKALFVLSDGVDRGSKEALEDAIEAAQRADTSVYSIFFAGDEQRGGGFDRGGGMGRGGGRPGGGGWPGVAGAAEAEADTIQRKIVLTGRRCWSGSRPKPAGSCLRSLRS